MLARREKEARVFSLRYFMFKTLIILKYFHIQTSAIKRKYPLLMFAFSLFQRTHIQYRDIFIFKHFAFTSEAF